MSKCPPTYLFKSKTLSRDKIRIKTYFFDDKENHIYHIPHHCYDTHTLSMRKIANKQM